MFEWGDYLILYLACLLVPFILAILHFSLLNKKTGKHVFFRLSSNYFVFINVFLKSFVLGIMRIYWGEQIASFDHLPYSFVFTEYGVLYLSIGIFGLISLFSNTSFRIAPSIFFGVFLILVSIVHWNQLESNILLAKSRYYLLIIFDVLTAIVLFYHSWALNKFVLLKERVV